MSEVTIDDFLTPLDEKLKELGQEPIDITIHKDVRDFTTPRGRHVVAWWSMKRNRLTLEVSGPGVDVDEWYHNSAVQFIGVEDRTVLRRAKFDCDRPSIPNWEGADAGRAVGYWSMNCGYIE